MNHYELTVLTRSEDDRAGVPELIEKLGGRILQETNLGKRRLAYPIANEAAAAYFVYDMEIDPVALPDFDLKLRRNDDVLRHLVIAGGIRKADKPAKKKNKEIEVPESVVKGMAELAQAEQNKASEPVTSTEATDDVTTEVETAVAEPDHEKPTDETPKKRSRKKAEPADELTAEERQKKLDEKLDEILKSE